MDGGVEKSKGHGQPERDDHAHPDGRNSRHGEVRPLLHPVWPTEHGHGVEEHESVAGDHEAGVEKEAGGGRVAKAGENWRFLIHRQKNLACTDIG